MQRRQTAYITPIITHFSSQLTGHQSVLLRSQAYSSLLSASTTSATDICSSSSLQAQSTRQQYYTRSEEFKGIVSRLLNHLCVEGWGDRHPPQQAHRPPSVKAAVESGVCLVEPRSNTPDRNCCRCFDTDGVGPGRVVVARASELLKPARGGGVRVAASWMIREF